MSILNSFYFLNYHPFSCLQSHELVPTFPLYLILNYNTHIHFCQTCHIKVSESFSRSLTLMICFSNSKQYCIICKTLLTFRILEFMFPFPYPNIQFSSVQLLSCVWLFVIPWTTARQPCLSITNSWSLRKLMSIESMMLSNHLILCHSLLLLPSIFPSIRVFSNESALRIRWTKYWSFSFKISPSKEHPGIISFRMDSLDLLAVQGTLKSLLQHHSSKASVLQCSAFFVVQLSHLHMTTGKTIALTRRTFVGKVMSLLFNMLSRLVITFLPRSKHLLISWLQSPSAVILEPPKK